jgi:aminoglycoside phosphotransferase (APT) family kinase protein
MDIQTTAEALAGILDVGSVDQFVPLSGGASRETWSFVAHDASPGGRKLILQIARRDEGHDSEAEARIMTAAKAAGVPVASIVHSSNDVAVLGGPFVVSEFVDGETLGPRILRDAKFDTVRARLPAQFGRALAAIHRMPVELAPAVLQEDILDQARREIDELGEPHPAFEIALKWLEANRRPDATQSFVHGDFRLGNMIVDASTGVRAILDWELARVRNPAEDIAWACLKPWRFGAPGYVAGIAPLRELLDAYEAAGGSVIDPNEVKWWEICGVLRWGIGCVIQAKAHANGERVSHELAAIGRRACENEYDLMRLIV